jgi:subtilisin family serine protease
MTRRLRIGVIDSGVHAAHPHIQGVAGGVGIARDGREEADYVDRIGHGTAVAAVIREKAPAAEIFAVKIFHDKLATRIETLVRAIDWCVENGMHLINLSVGTSNPDHEAALRAAVEHVRANGITLVAAYEDSGVRWLPGCLPCLPAVVPGCLPAMVPGCVTDCLTAVVGQALPPVSRLKAGLAPVALDWECPRSEYRTDHLPDGRTLFRASGFPRPIPGVPPERNLKGISFAVANVTGILAREASRTGRHESML